MTMGNTHDTSTARTTRRSAAALVAMAALTGLVACSGGDDDDAAGADAATAATFSAEAMPTTTMPGALLSSRGEAAPVGDMPQAPPTPAAGPAAVQVIGQSIAITAQTTVQAPDIRDAVDRITTTVTTRGGRVAAADVDFGTPPVPGDEDPPPPQGRATLVVAVPPGELPAVRATLEDVGDVLTFEQQAEDVSDQLADLDTRIANQRASVARIRELYATATDVESIVRIEAELTARETALEQLLAMQANITERVAMSTLTIDVSTTPPAAPGADDDGTSIGDALAAGWGAFAGGVFTIALALTAAMPFLLLAGAVGLVAWLVLRRSRPAAPPRNHPDPDADRVSEREAAASHPG